MGSMRNWMLGAAVLAGAASLASVPAQAAQFGIYVGIHNREYVPPCPGPGYFWTAGYMSRGFWVPGRWYFGGHRDRDRYFDRHDNWNGRGRDFERDRDRDRDRYRGHDRYHR
jgi:hypothetical protein